MMFFCLETMVASPLRNFAARSASWAEKHRKKRLHRKIFVLLLGSSNILLGGFFFTLQSCAEYVQLLLPPPKVDRVLLTSWKENFWRECAWRLGVLLLFAPP